MCLGVVGRITRTWDEGGVPMAAIESRGEEHAACLLYQPEAEVGAPVLAHMGFVLEVLTEERFTDAEGLRSEIG